MKVADLISKLESRRIDVDTACAYCDPTGELRERYGAKNEMLDDCIAEVLEFARSLSEMKDKIDSISTLAYMNGHRIEVKKDGEWMKKDIQEIVNEYI